MPFPNNHACRLIDPSQCQRDSFHSVERLHKDKRYTVRMAKKIGSNSIEEQSYLYPKDIWSKSDAREHCKNHKGSFEAASENKESTNAIDSLTERADHLLQKHILGK